MFAADGAARALGDRGEAGVGGEVTGGCEVLAGDFGEESGSGPDPDSGHADQDGMREVVAVRVESCTGGWIDHTAKY